MYILDTDHLSVLDRGGGAEAQRLLQRLAGVKKKGSYAGGSYAEGKTISGGLNPPRNC